MCYECFQWLALLINNSIENFRIKNVIPLVAFVQILRNHLIHDTESDPPWGWSDLACEILCVEYTGSLIARPHPNYHDEKLG